MKPMIPEVATVRYGYAHIVNRPLKPVNINVHFFLKRLIEIPYIYFASAFCFDLVLNSNINKTFKCTNSVISRPDRKIRRSQYGKLSVMTCPVEPE
jgi:hypothetical protein